MTMRRRAGCFQLKLGRSRPSRRPGNCMSTCKMEPSKRPQTRLLILSGRSRATTTMVPLKTAVVKAGSVNRFSESNMPVSTLATLKNKTAGVARRISWTVIGSSCASSKLRAPASQATSGAKNSTKMTMTLSTMTTKVRNEFAICQSSGRLSLSA